MLLAIRETNSLCWLPFFFESELRIIVVTHIFVQTSAVLQTYTIVTLFIVVCIIDSEQISFRPYTGVYKLKFNIDFCNVLGLPVSAAKP